MLDMPYKTYESLCLVFFCLFVSILSKYSFSGKYASRARQKYSDDHISLFAGIVLL